MQTPQENEKGYDDNSPVNHAEKLEGKLLQSMELVTTTFTTKTH